MGPWADCLHQASVSPFVNVESESTHLVGLCEVQVEGGVMCSAHFRASMDADEWNVFISLRFGDLWF